jgi:murein endopeptidase
MQQAYHLHVKIQCRRQSESNNLAARYPQRAERMKGTLLDWHHRSLPEPAGDVKKPGSKIPRP